MIRIREFILSMIDSHFIIMYFLILFIGFLFFIIIFVIIMIFINFIIPIILTNKLIFRHFEFYFNFTIMIISHFIKNYPN